MNVAAKHLRREVDLEGEQCDWWQVVENNDGQDDEDHLEGSLLHRMHVISAGARLPQSPENHYVAEHHGGKRHQDHRRKDFLKVDNVANTFSGSIG